MNIKAFLDLGENVAVEFKRYGLCQVNVGNYLIFLNDICNPNFKPHFLVLYLKS